MKKTESKNNFYGGGYLDLIEDFKSQVLDDIEFTYKGKEYWINENYGVEPFGWYNLGYVDENDNIVEYTFETIEELVDNKFKEFDNKSIKDIYNDIEST